MTTYASYPATAYYPEYLAQPTYQVEPHPYGTNYTTSAHLQPEQYERPSSRRTVSPASSNDHSDASRGHRRRRSSVYLDAGDDRIVVTGGSPSRRDRERSQRSRERDLQREQDLQLQHDFEKEERRRRRQERREREAAAERREQQQQQQQRDSDKPTAAAASSSSSKPIPFTRSSTMPTGHSIAPSHERGRRPIIMSEQVYDSGEVSARIPIGPVQMVEHASSRGRSSGGSGSSRRYSTSRHDRPATPQGYASNEEELYRRADQRVRNRDEVRGARGGHEFASSAPERDQAIPTAGYESYGSSYGSSASGFTPPPSRGHHRRMSSSASRGSAAAEAATKNLRWADQETRQGILSQNERIMQRPKLGRSESVKANRPLQGEVKSILKNGNSGQNSANTTGAPPTPTSASRPSSSERPRSRRDSLSRRDNLEGLSRAMGGLSTEDPEYNRRLADRFAMPTRRHSTFGPGAGSNLRTHYLDDRDRRW